LNKWLKYLLWTVGMFLIMVMGNYYSNAAHRVAAETFKTGPLLWIVTIVPFAFGVYLSLLFVKPPSRVNLPLLVMVFLPSALLSLYVPMAAYAHLRLPLWMAQTYILTFEGIVAGLSFMLAIFV